MCSWLTPKYGFPLDDGVVEENGSRTSVGADEAEHVQNHETDGVEPNDVAGEFLVQLRFFLFLEFLLGGQPGLVVALRHGHQGLVGRVRCWRHPANRMQLWIIWSVTARECTAFGGKRMTVTLAKIKHVISINLGALSCHCLWACTNIDFTSHDSIKCMHHYFWIYELLCRSEKIGCVQ